METLREWLSRLWGSFRRTSHDRDIEEELRSHEQLAAEDMRRRGVSDEDAIRETRLRYGTTTKAIEALYDQRGLPWLDDLTRDLRYALRSLWRSPVFTIVALASLAVAIGANTTIFSVVNAVLLKPLPYRSPEQLVILSTGMPGQNQGRPAYRTVEEWRSRSQSFSDIAVRDPASVTWTTSTGAERISVLKISANSFPLLGIQPLHGRAFSEEEATQRRRVVLISHRLWR